MVNFRGLSVSPIVALGVLAIVAGAGAYYYFVYLPETEIKPATVVQAPVKSRIVAKKTQKIAKPTASAVPAVAVASAPVAAPVQLASVTTQLPVPAQKPEPVKTKTVVRKPAPKKTKAKSRPVQPVEEIKPTVPEKSQQILPAVPMVLPEPVVAAAVPRIITPKYNDMLTAVLRGDKEGVKQLLDLGRWADKPGTSGLTPLMAGIMNRDTQIVQLLLERGAEPTVQALNLAKKNKDSAIVSLLEQHIEH